MEHFKPHDIATENQRADHSDHACAGASPVIGFTPNFIALNAFRSAASPWARTVQSLGSSGSMVGGPDCSSTVVACSLIGFSLCGLPAPRRRRRLTMIAEHAGRQSEHISREDRRPLA